MSPAELIRRARVQAGLSQRGLARRARTVQSVVARIENGTTSPTWETLTGLLRAAGFELRATLARRPPTASPPPLDAQRLITTLARHEVRYVLIGAMAAQLRGSTRTARVAIITPSREAANVRRLVTALRELDARPYTESAAAGLPFDRDIQALAARRRPAEPGALWSLATSAGRLEVAFEPKGTTGYLYLIGDAASIEVFGARVDVVSRMPRKQRFTRLVLTRPPREA